MQCTPPGRKAPEPELVQQDYWPARPMMDTLRGKRAKAMDEVDRISGLPDELRRRILSFLPARDAVRTSVLSPKWRHLWASVRRLNVDIEGFTSQSSFINFVNALLLSRASNPLESFRLSADADHIIHEDFCDTAYLWIRHALMSNIEELGITYTCHKHFRLNHCPFTSSYLKKLHLCYVKISNRAIKKLFSGCPALEDLEICNCEIFATEFSSATMKSLRIEYACFRNTDDKDIVINMPSLVSIHIEEFCGVGMLSLVDVQSLLTASICLVDFTFAAACKILGALSNVKKLELLFELDVEGVYSFETGESLFGSGMQLCQVMFANLTSLSLSDWCLHDNCKPLLHVLQHSPNLEDLTLKIWKHEYIDSSCSAAAADSAAPSNCKKLRKVKIDYQRGRGDKTVGMVVTILLTKLMHPLEIIINP